MKKGTKFQHKCPDEPQVCAICGFPLKTYNALGKHVAKYHSSQCTMKEYVDKYIEPFAHKCPYCDNERNFVHGRYKETCPDKKCIQKHREATNVQKYGNKCSLKGTNEQKVVDAIVEKYGVDNVFKLDSMQQFARQRTKEKYGKEYSSQVPELRKKVEETCMKKFGYKTNLLNPDQIEQIKRTCLEKYGNQYVCASEYTRQKTIEHNQQMYGVDWFMSTEDFRNKSTETCLQLYGVSKTCYIPGMLEKRRKTNLERYGIADFVTSPIAKSRRCESARAKYGVDYPMQDPVVWKRITNGVRTDGFLSKSEANFAMWCNHSNIVYKYDEWINQKHWDFTIYYNGKLDFIVEIDGEWCHGLLGDSDGKRQARERKNIERLSKIPNNVKYLCTDSANIKKAFDYLVSRLGCPYDDWVNDMFNDLPMDFPYPVYKDSRLINDFRRLRECVSYNGSELGMSTIYHFNKSLYEWHSTNTISPVDAWRNKEILHKCIQNKELYHSVFSSINMISYLYLSDIVKLHSVVSPGMIKRVLDNYLYNASTIVDPYAYTGNVLLGCASIGKRYIGYGVNAKIQQELRSIADFHHIDADILDDMNSATLYGDSLLTCIPLDANVDECIYWCTKNIRCDRYVFIVHDTVLYDQYVVERNDKYGDNGCVVVI